MVEFRLRISKRCKMRGRMDGERGKDRVRKAKQGRGKDG